MWLQELQNWPGKHSYHGIMTLLPLWYLKNFCCVLQALHSLVVNFWHEYCPFLVSVITSTSSLVYKIVPNAFEIQNKLPCHLAHFLAKEGIWTGNYQRNHPEYWLSTGCTEAMESVQRYHTVPHPMVSSSAGQIQISAAQKNAIDQG